MNEDYYMTDLEIADARSKFMKEFESMVKPKRTGRRTSKSMELMAIAKNILTNVKSDMRQVMSDSDRLEVIYNILYRFMLKLTELAEEGYTVRIKDIGKFYSANKQLRYIQK